MQPYKIRYKPVMVLRSKIKIDVTLPTEELVEIYFTSTPNAYGMKQKICCIDCVIKTFTIARAYIYTIQSPDRIRLNNSYENKNNLIYINWIS
jgi:hypothetical protein